MWCHNDVVIYFVEKVNQGQSFINWLNWLTEPLLCAGLWSWGTDHLAVRGYTGPVQRPAKRDHQAVLCKAWTTLYWSWEFELRSNFTINVYETIILNDTQYDASFTTLHWKLRVDMMPTLSSLMACTTSWHNDNMTNYQEQPKKLGHDNSLLTEICCDDKVGIRTNFIFNVQLDT